MRTPETSLRSDSSLGKRPTMRVRFLIWPLIFPQALDVRRRFLQPPEMLIQNFLREACQAVNEERPSKKPVRFPCPAFL